MKLPIEHKSFRQELFSREGSLATRARMSRSGRQAPLAAKQFLRCIFDDMLAVTARWIFPVAGPPVERGILVFDGERIVGIEPHGSRKPDRDFGNAAILPGLVNAHTHLDLTGMRGLAPPSPDFTNWLREVIAHRRQRTPDEIADDIREGLAESLRSGTTLIGDVSGDGSSWAELADAPMRAVIYREMLGLTKDRAERAWQSAQQWLGKCQPTPTCRPGLSPHAPYSTRVSLIKAAAGAGVPFAIHLAESAAERELLEEHSGPFVSFLQELGVWDPLGLAKSPEHVIRLAAGTGPALFVHGNFLAPTAPIPPSGTVVLCPRTHHAFGHPPHPVHELLARGVRVALGTDGLSSNPDLSILNEMRFLHADRPDLPTETVLKMATLWGAEALGLADECGTLEPGRSADFVAVQLADEEESDPHELWLEGDGEPAEVWFRGQSG
jgi:cytosine/adenosine deaminase-related metal-dependent hydrolase